jgi:hypothetical protein
VISGGDTPVRTAPKDSPRFNADAGERRNGLFILCFIQNTEDFAQLSLPEQQIVNSLLSSIDFHREIVGLDMHEKRTREHESSSILHSNFVHSNHLPDNVAHILNAMSPNAYHAIHCDIRWRERLIRVMIRKINSLLVLYNSNITD